MGLVQRAGNLEVIAIITGGKGESTGGFHLLSSHQGNKRQEHPLVSLARLHTSNKVCGKP